MLGFATAADWEAWLAENHADPTGVWLKLKKKGGAEPLVTYLEALEVALCWGWIDGQAGTGDAHHYRQRFTPRRKASPWSKINRDRVEALTAAGRMRPPGQSEVDRAKEDGRWERAYDGARTATVPDDLTAALAASPKAKALFDALDGANRFAILYRVQTAKTETSRAAQVAKLVAMLAEGKTIHPRAEKKAAVKKK